MSHLGHDKLWAWHLLVLGTAMGLARAEDRAPGDQCGCQQGEIPTACTRGYPGLTGSPLPTPVRQIQSQQDREGTIPTSLWPHPALHTPCGVWVRGRHHRRPEKCPKPLNFRRKEVSKPLQGSYWLLKLVPVWVCAILSTAVPALALSPF